MVVSRQNLIKDIMVIFILIGLSVVSYVLVVPQLQEKYLRFAQQSYLNEQTRVIRQAVENESIRIVHLDRMLAAEGLNGTRRTGVLLDQLKDTRFGIDDYGYFYIFDRNLKLIMQPVQPSLVGRYLGSVYTLDGESMADVMNGVLRSTGEGYVHYRWSDTGGIAKKKTVYVKPVAGTGWILAAGFYHEDMEKVSEPYLRLSRRAVTGTALSMGLVFLISLIIVGIFMVIMYLRIRATERDLSRHMSVLEQYKLILDESSLVSRTDASGNIIYVNDKFCETTGYRREEVSGRSHNVERHQDTPLEVFKGMWEAISGGAPWSGVIKNRKADGSSYYKRVTIVPIKNENGEIVEYLSSGQDVSEIIEKRGEIEKAFSTDSLTGLGNRMRLLGDIETMGSPALALINIRNFSGMNQTLGHENGDMIIRKLASDVFEFARLHGSVAYRVYADTFALLCPCTDDDDRVTFTKGIASRFSGISYPLDADSVDVHVYVGIAFQGRDSFVYADMALAHAKKSGAPIHVFNPEDAGLETDSAHNINVLKMIHDAIRNHRIIPYFQPIIDVRTGATTKYECLIRIINSDGAVIYPDAFIPVAKKTDVYPKLTLRMLEKSMDLFEKLFYDFSVNFTIE
ncbi:MAG TPA: PAS domain S-box protein, partial [Spirochaetota bacterium]|nr:PAS domain S-box protein [Spirochaetota bacterium]